MCITKWPQCGSFKGFGQRSSISQRNKIHILVFLCKNSILLSLFFKYSLSLYITFYLYSRRSCSKSKPDYSNSPYSSGDLNQSWPIGITPIPRASTNWDATPPIEMTEGGSTRALVDKKHQTNGLVSYRRCFSQMILRLTVMPLCSVLPHHLASRLHLLINLKLTLEAWIC